MSSRFRGLKNYQHGETAKLGILIVNLGTPEKPTAKALRIYLAEFLSDPRVVEIPRIIWKMILHGIILRTRPSKSAKAYQTVWSDGGSPLMVHSAQLTEAVASEIKNRIPGETLTLLAMRYGKPSISEQLQKMQQQGVERILVLPLYPQYSGATTGSVNDAVFAEMLKWRWIPELRMMGAYHDHPEYIKSIAHSVRMNWEEHGQGEKLLISFHGMPKRTLILGDPYFCHCHKSARLIAEELNLHESEWELMFQSRFGKAEWLQPYAAERFEQLPTEGVKNVTIICPGFAVDCLETLEEIKIAGAKSFLDAGGESFQYVPCLNAGEAHIELQLNRIFQHASGWPEITDNHQENDQQAEKSREYALRAGGQ